MMRWKNRKAMVLSPDGNTDFNIIAELLEWDILVLYTGQTLT